MKNVIYYENVLSLGGTTTYEIELCKKYCETKDITLLYKNGSKERIAELENYVRCIKWNGEEIECDNLFTNYDHSGIEKIKAKKYYQVIHAQYITNKIKPKVEPIFDYYICVSKVVRKEFIELTNLPKNKVLVSYNPITIEDSERKPPLIIGSFTRLSWEKGKDKMQRLIQELDRQKVNYLWFIYTSDINAIKSNNVIYQKPISNVRNIMAMCDIVAQLSLCEGDCYTIKEAKSIMDKVLITPCPSFFEMGCDRNKDIVLEQDLSNIDEVISRLKEMADNKKPRQSKFIPKGDKYNKLLINGNNNYRELVNKKYRVKALKEFENVVDNQVGRKRKENEEFIVNGVRKETLLKHKLIEVLSEC